MKTEELIKVSLKLKLKLRDYQKEGAKFLIKNNESVLAMCPGAGKTVTSIYGIIEYLINNPNEKVLVLTHSTKVLLMNFVDEVVEFGLGEKIGKNKDGLKSEIFSINFELNKRVHICLPQNIKKINQKYGLLVIDEAHENYLSKKSIKNEEEESATNEYVMQQIVNKITKKGTILKQWLLTGTPSKFIRKGGYNLYTIAINEIEKKYRAKLDFELIYTKADWKNFYNKDLNLSTKAKISKESSEETLSEIISIISKRLKKTVSKKERKTLIVCKDTKHANDVFKILLKRKYNVAISHCKNDADSEAIKNFKNNLYDILVVVRRARLGYSDCDLFNLVDFSGTHNIDLIYQMFSRVVRGNQSMKKLFIKVTTNEQTMKEATEAYTNAALQLTDKRFLSTFNGNNYDILLAKDFKTEELIHFTKNKGKKTNSGQVNSGQKFVDSSLKNDLIETIKKVSINLGNGNKLFGTTTLEEAINKIKGYNNWSRFEYVFKDAQRFSSTAEWLNPKIGSPNSYKSAYRNGWLEECTKHMKKPEFPRGYFSNLENCKLSSKNYDTPTKWRDGCPRAYDHARKNGWLEICCKHMKNKKDRKQKGYWDIFKNVEKDSLRFDFATQWSDLSNASYTSAIKNGWLEKLTKRMKNPKAKNVLMKHKLTGKPIKTFTSTIEAAKYIKGDSSSISKVCLGKSNSHKGYKFEYVS